MENWIDDTYFEGELLVANVSQEAVLENLTAFIKKYQKKFLKKLLGEPLYDDLVAGFDVVPPVLVAQKWVDLKNKLVDSEDVESPIANYVYYWYKMDQKTATVGTGTVKPKAENAVMVNSTDKQVRAWNEMVGLVRESYYWILTQTDEDGNLVYPNLQASCFQDIFEVKNSLGI